MILNRRLRIKPHLHAFGNIFNTFIPRIHLKNSDAHYIKVNEKTESQTQLEISKKKKIAETREALRSLSSEI